MHFVSQKKSLQIIWKIGLSIVLRLVATDSSIKIVAVTGEGDYYSSGNDLSNFLEAEVKESNTIGIANCKMCIFPRKIGMGLATRISSAAASASIKDCYCRNRG